MHSIYTMFCIYVLYLEGNNYYIGDTNNLENDLIQHFCGNGCSWTKLHKPLYLLEIYIAENSYDTDKMLDIFINKYGKNKIRSGSFVGKQNTESEKIKFKIYPEKSYYSSLCSKYCLKCHKEGHYLRDC